MQPSLKFPDRLLGRAMSTAYYAAFHFIARSSADLLIGKNRNGRSKHAWRQVYRALDHGPAKNACADAAVVARFPAAIQDFANLFKEMQEKRPINNGRFTYVWDQHSYDPITGSAVCKIHFHFPDGSKIRDAFTYHWRLWTLPELRELLAEAGFARSTVYWEGTDEETGEGDGDFQPREHQILFG